MVSAVKHAGRRLYELAREGREVERAARPVTVHTLELVAFDAGPPPRARLAVCCSSGTYVRTLIHDLGAALGPGAAMASLVRTAVGPFRLADAVAVEQLTAAAARGPEVLVAELPRRELSEAEVTAVTHGRPVPAGEIQGGERVALFAAGELVAVAERAADGLKPRIVVTGA